jgi:hypothetical protein
MKGEIMPTLIKNPSIIESAGNKPKIIREFVGLIIQALKRSV